MHRYFPFDGRNYINEDNYDQIANDDSFRINPFSQLFPQFLLPPSQSPNYQGYPPSNRPPSQPPNYQTYPPHNQSTWPGHGGGSFQGGQGDGPPTTPPPSYTPQGQQDIAVFAVDPGAIRRCIYRFTYVWLENGQRFWFYPVFIGRTSIAGWRWQGHRWVYFGTDLNNINNFQCQ